MRAAVVILQMTTAAHIQTDQVNASLKAGATRALEIPACHCKRLRLDYCPLMESSSISKISVELGPITPPAPFAP